MDQVSSLDSTFGALFIGVVVGAVLYGVSCAQVFYYFQHYSKKDGLGTKAVVVATLISDTVHQALICHTIYTYTITYYFQPQKLGTLIWSPVVAVIFSGITAFIVQSFYAVRIWKFSQKNVIIAAALSIFIVGEFVSTMVYVAKSINMTTFAEVTKLKALAMAVNVLAAVGDVLITIVFCALLHGARTNLRRSNTMINLLIVFSVQTGMLTSIFAVAALISITASPDTFIYMTFYFLLSRLYFNSLLGSLNIRKAIRGRGGGSVGIPLGPIDGSNLSTMDNHKVDGKSTSRPGSQVSKPTDISQGSKPTVVMITRQFVQPMSHTNSSRVAGTESDLDSGRSQHLRRASF